MLCMLAGVLLVVGPPSIQFGISVGSIYALAILGLILFVSIAGMPSLGHGAFMAIGAYASGVATVRWDLSFVTGVGIGLSVNIVLGLLLAFGLMKLRPYYLAMATLALALGVQATLISASRLTGGTGGLPRIPHAEVAGMAIQGDVAYGAIALLLLLVASMLVLNLYDSHVGRALRAIHIDETASLVLGIRTTRLKIVAFMVSIVLASIAGSLFAHHLNFVSPGQFGVVLSVELLIMVSLAAGRLQYALGGAVIWQAVRYMTSDVPDLRMVLTGALLWLIIMHLSSEKKILSGGSLGGLLKRPGQVGAS